MSKHIYGYETRGWIYYDRKVAELVADGEPVYELIRREQPQAADVVCWWNDIPEDGTGEADAPSYSSREDTHHDIPLYAGWNEASETVTNLRAHIAQLEEQAPVKEPVMHAWSSQAALDVLAERRRQIEREGWTPEHDDSHRDQSLSVAAACYALAGVQGARPGALSPHYLASFTGWGSGWFKPTDPRRNIIKAAALLLAEIERLDRAALISERTSG